VETFAADDAILSAIAEGSGAVPHSLAEAAALAHGGDRRAREAFSQAGRALGLGLATLVNLLNPPMVILSGEGINASDLLMGALTEQLAESAFSSAAQDCRLVVRPLPDEAWARGAAATMLKHGVLASLMTLVDEVPD
jgi:predicted NBD/HSP70 family sugar kinase